MMRDFLKKLAYYFVINQIARNLWEPLLDCVHACTFGMSFIFTRLPRPKLLLYFGYSPGDDLLCTAILREYRIRGRAGLFMISNNPELFICNDDPAQVRPLWQRYSADSSTVA